ncbi:hypothetical protein BH09CHL1_BH09CHL1_04590 [soil metagenome]
MKVEVTFANPEVASVWPYIVESIDRLVATVVDFGADGMHWRPSHPDANSVAVLAVHTMGNLEESVLFCLCGIPVGRVRASEFDVEHMSVIEIQQMWTALRPRIETALSTLTIHDLSAPNPGNRDGMTVCRDLLNNVNRHAAEHSGQAELTRDLFKSRTS